MLSTVSLSRLASLLGLLIVVAGMTGCSRGTDIPTADVYGTVTINGQPVEGVEVRFVPDAKVRSSIGLTDAQGRYEAEFVSTQSGVALGACVVQFSIYRGSTLKNYLPKEFNENAVENPEFKLDIPKQGLEFDYDIKYDGKIPPYTP